MEELFKRADIVRRKFMRIMPRMNANIIMPKEDKESCLSNLTISEIKTLVLFKDQSTYNMSKIAEFVGMPLPTTTHVVDRMVKEGFLERSLDEKDRRVVNISITAKGKKSIEDSEKYHKESMKRVLETMEPEDREKLIKAMEIFIKVVEEIGEKKNSKAIRNKSGNWEFNSCFSLALPAAFGNRDLHQKFCAIKLCLFNVSAAGTQRGRNSHRGIHSFSDAFRHHRPARRYVCSKTLSGLAGVYLGENTGRG